jgi:hypothetical protein
MYGFISQRRQMSIKFPFLMSWNERGGMELCLADLIYVMDI